MPFKGIEILWKNGSFLKFHPISIPLSVSKWYFYPECDMQFLATFSIIADLCALSPGAIWSILFSSGPGVRLHFHISWGQQEAPDRHLPTPVPNFKVYLESICLKSIRTHLIIISIPICASRHKNPPIPMILLNFYILNSIRL